MSKFGNFLKWAWALTAANYLSNNAVLQAIDWTQKAVSTIISSGGNAIWNAMPFAWVAAPFALAWHSIYKWFQEAWKTNVWNWVQDWTLRYWAIWTAATYAWLLSIPLAPQILATWLWMYWTKKIVSAIADSYSTVKEWHPIDTIANLPWKTWDWIKWLKWTPFWWNPTPTPVPA